MTMDKDVKAIGFLMLGLFFLLIITAVVFIGEAELKKVACTQANPGHVFNDSLCHLIGNSTVTRTVTTIDKIDIVVLTIDIVLALLALVVIVVLFKIVIRTAQSFTQGGSGKF